jgi:ABC-type multidrug transport system permease subunit
MQTENWEKPDRFDRFLKDALKQYRQPIPAGFPRRMLGRFQQFQQQEALRKVIRQERVSLAAFILLPTAVIISVLIFPNLLLVSSQLQEVLYLLAKETAASMVQQWQLWTGYAVIAAVMIYAVYGVLLADN